MLLSHFAGARQVLSYIHMTHARMRLRNVPVYVYAHQRDLQGGFVFRKKCVDVGAFSKDGMPLLEMHILGLGQSAFRQRCVNVTLSQNADPPSSSMCTSSNSEWNVENVYAVFYGTQNHPTWTPLTPPPPPPSDNTNCILAQALERVYLDMCIMN